MAFICHGALGWYFNGGHLIQETYIQVNTIFDLMFSDIDVVIWICSVHSCSSINIINISNDFH